VESDMSRTVTIDLPLPRVVVGERSGSVRNGGPERFCVLDDVPVPVRSVPGTEAPEALRLRGGMPRSWHVHEGLLYAPLFQVAEGGADAAGLAEGLRDRVGDLFREGRRAPPRGETVVDYREAFQYAARSAGLFRQDGLRMRTVVDDGVAARDAIASRLARSLLVVDGVAMHPSPTPYHEVAGVDGPAGRRVAAHARAPFEVPYARYPEGTYIPGSGFTKEQTPFDRVDPWMAFEPWRGDEARDFAGRLAAMGYDGAGAVDETEPRFEVVDRAALEAAAGGAGPASFAERTSRRFLEVSGTGLHLRPDAVLLGMMEHRHAVAALAAGGSAESAMETLRGYSSLLGGEAAAGMPRDARETRARLMLLRYDEYERPLWGLEARYGEDVDGLMRLVP
jgi:hypothetical protein